MTEPAPPPPKLICGKCNVELSMGKVSVGYMGNAFEVDLLRCPQCHLTYVPEDLALGKMLKVEQALEEK
jgi:Zn-finger nucleic acid-binding protein